MYTNGGKTKGRTAMYNQRRACFSSHDPKADKHQPWAALGAWFLGPKGENGDVFRQLVLQAVDSQINFRKKYFPCDPTYVTDEVKESETYQNSMAKLKKELRTMQTQLEKSVPFFSSRYKVRHKSAHIRYC